MDRTVTIDDVKERSLDDFLEEVARGQDVVTVVLPQGDSVEIRPTPILKPLPRLRGTAPAGWKDALYRE